MYDTEYKAMIHIYSFNSNPMNKATNSTVLRCNLLYVYYNFGHSKGCLLESTTRSYRVQVQMWGVHIFDLARWKIDLLL